MGRGGREVMEMTRSNLLGNSLISLKEIAARPDPLGPINTKGLMGRLSAITFVITVS